LATIVLLLAGAGMIGYVGWTNPARFRTARAFLTKALAVPAAAGPAPTTPAASQPWDGLVRLGQRGRTSMGIVTTKTAPQTEPIRLELLGTTEYDTETLSRIRLMFKGRVDKVYT
jgi:cobalt-zinc-cadmium efflux system membrane fusion protein